MKRRLAKVAADHPSEHRNVASRWVTAVVSLTVIVLAFWFFLSGRMEGGPFVSMLTLGLGLAGIARVWDRIEQFTLFGSEIKLRNLTKDAELMLSSLDGSRLALYRIALRLVKRESGGYSDLFDTRDGRGADAIALLREIEKASLIDQLSPEIMTTVDAIIKDAQTKLLEHPIFAQRDEPPTADEMVRIYNDHSISGPTAMRQDSSIDGHLPVAIEQLRLLLEYRQKAAALQDSVTSG
ncbi:hypothetical protein MHM84_14420 [Halomonas sp. McH1-25]|uniref:hypothetical protein n=1 Tax=unclassified Halomonas TaxID=2609666 RepID=UPI001EF4F4B9|nr:MULTISPECIES: hypothetical protein [unclassified Halomonas]MCG7600976.1 hypothetical protein [Halomonas sp. McH1-25]MCP1342068.1 hypothetical protein [Halomonas sp. FL8]MCP1359750.1 hypothetical protein [Halomonas sp. BBD45]MCP1365036.1 hypothetical protein [Halomonas sp. BBD48]